MSLSRTAPHAQPARRKPSSAEASRVGACEILTDKQLRHEQDMVISWAAAWITPQINLTRSGRARGKSSPSCRKEMARAYKLSPVCKLGNKLTCDGGVDRLTVLALEICDQRHKMRSSDESTERAVTKRSAGSANSSAQMASPPPSQRNEPARRSDNKEEIRTSIASAVESRTRRRQDRHLIS